MKHLIKFNENKEEIDDIINYIKLVFAEFSDDTKYDLDYEGPDKLAKGGYYFDILINIPIAGFGKTPYKDNIKSLINNSNELVEFYSDIEVCMKRVKDEYPSIESSIGVEPDIRNDFYYYILYIYHTIK